MSQKTGSTNTDNQLGLVLNDVAASAKTIERIAVMLIHETDERDIEALTVAIKSMAQRIGLLADGAAAGIPGSMGPCCGVTPAEWMMPRMYFKEACETSEG